MQTLKVQVSFYIEQSLIKLELPDARLPRVNDIPGLLVGVLGVERSFMSGCFLTIKLSHAIHQGKKRKVTPLVIGALKAIALEPEDRINWCS